MAMNSAISVRLEPELEIRLERVSRASGLSKADLLRRATIEFMERAEQEGTITLPAVHEQTVSYRTNHKKHKN